jgi:hypothetical protein
MRVLQSVDSQNIVRKMMILTFFLGLLNFAVGEIQSEQVIKKIYKGQYKELILFRIFSEALKTVSCRWKKTTTTSDHLKRSTRSSEDLSVSISFELQRTSSFK